MQKDKVETIESWLADAEVLTSLTADQQHAVRDLVGHPGFRYLWGVLMAEKQGIYNQMTLTPLSGNGPVFVSVLQGRVKGIEQIGSTLIELAQ